MATQPDNSSATPVAGTLTTNDQQTTFDDVSLPYVVLLRILGLLPFKGRDYGFLGTRVLLALFVLTNVINWTMLIGYSYSMQLFTVDIVCETVMVFGMHLRYCVIISRRRRLLAMMQECKAIWSECISEGGHRTVCAFERQVRVLMMLLMGSFSFITVLYTSNALLHRLPALEPNGTERRLLPYKWYYDVEDRWPDYWITFSIQQVVVNCASLITTGCDSASPFLMTIVSGYFRYLADYFYSTVKLKSACAHQQYYEFIRHVKLHQRLLTFCAELEQFCRIIFLIQVLSTGYNISLAGIMIVGSDPDKYKYISILFVCFYQLLLCQWAPDKLFTESSHISTATYFSSVTWMKSRVGKLLLVIIARAQHPVQMTAGGVVNLSLERFGSMMTSAVSFFTVLRNFNL